MTSIICTKVVSTTKQKLDISQLRDLCSRSYRLGCASTAPHQPAEVSLGPAEVNTAVFDPDQSAEKCSDSHGRRECGVVPPTVPVSSRSRATANIHAADSQTLGPTNGHQEQTHDYLLLKEVRACCVHLLSDTVTATWASSVLDNR